jgi:hypothetical protein
MAVRVSALLSGRPLLSRRFLVLVSVRGCVDPKGIIWLQGLGLLKNPATSSGSEPTSSRLVALCPNQPRSPVPSPPYPCVQYHVLFWTAPACLQFVSPFNTWIVFLLCLTCPDMSMSAFCRGGKQKYECISVIGPPLWSSSQEFLATERRCNMFPVRYEPNLYMLCRRK